MKRLVCILMAMISLGNYAYASGGIMALPLSLSRIEEQSFFGNSSLEEVVLPEGLLSIESQAFAYSGVKTINLPETITYIADDAFLGCDLKHVEAKGEYALSWCKANGIQTTSSPGSDEGEPFKP